MRMNIITSFILLSAYEKLTFRSHHHNSFLLTSLKASAFHKYRHGCRDFLKFMIVLIIII